MQPTSSDQKTEDVSHRQTTPLHTTTLHIEGSSSIVRQPPLLTVEKIHLNRMSHHVRHPLNTVETMRQTQRLFSALDSKQTWDILYVVAEQGVAWKGSIQRMIKANRSITYRQVEILESIGILQTVGEKHPEVKARIALTRSLNGFCPRNVTEFYTLNPEYQDAINALLEADQDLVARRTKENTQKVLRMIADQKKQRDELSRAANDTMTLHHKRTKLCYDPACHGLAAADGWCIKHWGWARNNPEEAQKILQKLQGGTSL